MRKTVISVLLIIALTAVTIPVFAVDVVGDEVVSIPADAGVLMEKISGEIMYEKNAHERMVPASVTKVMTMLLVMEEIAAGRMTQKDMVTCSSHAASMGGSQIWLEEGEQMSVGDMLKAVAVVSANDCAVALGEHISGSESSFVMKMNIRAQELGMENTTFVDCTGLTDDPQHLTTAYDIALMSRELIKYDEIKEYTTIWMDSLRDEESELTNTNKLVRFYQGATGLKTGFTNEAMFCLSATAERDGVEYIAVVLHAQTSDERFESAKLLLNYAFANYALCPLRSDEALPPVRVSLGEVDSVQPVYCGEEGKLLEKSKLSGIRYETNLPEVVEAPVYEGDIIGEMIVYSGDEELTRVELAAGCDVEKLTVQKIYGALILRLFGG